MMCVGGRGWPSRVKTRTPDGTSGTCRTNRREGLRRCCPQGGTDADGGDGKRTAARRDAGGLGAGEVA